MNESKSVTVYINNYGEQYLDIVSLVILWSLSILGFFLLLRSNKEKTTTQSHNQYMKGKTVLNEHGVYLGVLRNILLDENTGSVTSILVESSADMTQYSDLRNDDGCYVFPLEFIKSTSDVVIVKS